MLACCLLCLSLCPAPLVSIVVVVVVGGVGVGAGVGHLFCVFACLLVWSFIWLVGLLRSMLFFGHHLPAVCGGTVILGTFGITCLDR